MTESEWAELVRRNQGRVFSIALSVLKHVEEAKEITQDVFMKLHIHMDSITDKNSIPAWLMRTSYNSSINRLRVMKLRRFIFGTEGIEDLASSEATQEEKLRASQEYEKIQLWRNARLSARENVIIQLKHGEELTLREIAISLKLSESSVKTHYYRAVEKLEALIGRSKGGGCEKDE